MLRAFNTERFLEVAIQFDNWADPTIHRGDPNSEHGAETDCF